MNQKTEGGAKAIDLLSIILMAGSIIWSVMLFMQGKREQAIFVGLWPPTFVSLGNLVRKTLANGD